MKSVAIMTSGGDAAGMNPAVKCAVEYARSRDVEPFLVYDGLRGLIDGSIKAASDVDLSGMLHRGGTLLRTARSKRFHSHEHREAATRNLEARGIEKLLVIGGDGSFQGLNQLHADFGVPFVGIPATIDNDIAGTDYCLGVDTALNVICRATDSLRDTAASMRRAFVVEVMGRNCGYLAMVSSLASGAEICLVPEIPYDLAAIDRRLQSRVEEGTRSIFAIVAEGTRYADHLTRWFNDTLNVESRMTVLGHVQRGGSPTVYDRLMAYKFAVAAIEALLDGEDNSIIVHRRGAGFSRLPVHEVVEGKKEIDPMLMELCRPLCG
ncbi:MAG: 6-phosphofructokinase [Akkermansiaceae bacterium]|nr:6-phosphofructokinase [Akkermansiaceae bacterium]NNM29277.1 6-phosphofructokinase [Akkermansiaceae bacterium]